MNIRLFSKKHNLYTNSPFWPSNQRSFSDWALTPSGEVVEIVSFDDERSSSYVTRHDTRTFEVEPWTGYFDKNGKKIYRGDILGAFKGVNDEIDPSYETEVVWYEGGFCCKEDGISADCWMPLDCENRAWKRHFIKGNIHDVEYND